MSVLQSVKQKLHSVQEDLLAGFHSLSTLEINQKKRNSNSTINSNEIFVNSSPFLNFDAGAELLDKFQSYWAAIHENSEENAKRAMSIDKELIIHLLFIEKQSVKCQQLSTELKHIQFISQDIQNLHGSLAQLEATFHSIEQDLDELNDICDEVEFVKNRKGHSDQLKSWEDVRVKEMQELKVRMSQEHAKKIQAFEQDKWQKMRDKQEVLQEAFLSDMAQYRELGRVERSFHSASLEIGDIEIPADNTSELDEFLKVEDVTVETVEGGEDNSERCDDQSVMSDEDVTPESQFAMQYGFVIESTADVGTE